MKFFLKTLVSLLILVFLLTPNEVSAQNATGKKVTLLIMVNTRNPLTVAYLSSGDVIASRIISSAMAAATGLYFASSHGPIRTQNKKFLETMGAFSRHPFYKDSLLNDFKPFSDYINVDVGEDHAALTELHLNELTNPFYKRYNFILFLDEINAGLLTTELNTLSASSRVNYQLYDVKLEKLITLGHHIFASVNKRSKDEAIANGEAFANDYSRVVGTFCKTLYNDLLCSGKLHNIAETQGLGAFVPTYERYYKLVKQNYSLKVSSPKGWDVGTFARSESKFVNPRNRFEASQYMHGRVDVHKLIKDMKEEVPFDKYIESYIATKTSLGFNKDEKTTVNLTLLPGDVQFVMTDKEKVRHLYIFRKFKGIYAVSFQFEISQDFDRYVQEYKNDITAIMASTKVKT